VTSTGLLIVGLVILVGLFGVVLPILPGALLVLAAILFWAVEVGTTTAWAVFVTGALVIVVSQVAKYVLPGRRLAASGVPHSTLLIGAVVGIIGFFVVPVLGLFLGFVLGVYAAEYQRLGSHASAWPSTKVALKAVGLSLAIEMLGTLVAAGIWLTAVLTTR
jgi:uncharacterized protein YqgC (DUF456 family)